MSEARASRRVALVTGGAGGIGLAVCRALTLEGVCVTVLDRDAAAAAAVAQGLPGVSHLGLACDVADEASVAAAFDRAEQALGPMTILVCCAGIQPLRPDGTRAPVREMAADVWDATLAVNLRGTFLCCREFARRFRPAPAGGRIVTIGSISGQLGGIRASAAYSASKAAVAGLTKALARELAPDGITVNCVAPGVIDAPMLHTLRPPEDGTPIAASVPAGRLGTADEVADAVRYLASKAAAYVTGTTLDVNGGLLMR